MSGAADALVRAAGGVPWRLGDDGRLEVLIIHRTRYDDWSFPKGKLDPGETWEQAAVREVWEEARIVPVLGAELPSVEYLDHHRRPKQVRYWSMAVAVELDFTPDDEVHDRRWVDDRAAEEQLSYDHDRTVLAALVDLLTTT